jgi:hypothetical protein
MTDIPILRTVRFSSVAIAAVGMATALSLGGCASTVRIGDVLADPGRWASRSVSVEGDVVESLSVVGRGLYQVEDSTGRLWVVSDRGVPRQGARVEVRGQVRDAYDLTFFPGAPQGLRSAVVLLENRHELKR